VGEAQPQASLPPMTVSGGGGAAAEHADAP
jgi:hypothetical protein